MADASFEYVLKLKDSLTGSLGAIRSALGRVDTQVNRTQKTLQGLQKSVFSVKGALVGLGGVAITKGIIDTTAEFQKYNAVLANTFQSQDKAKESLQQLAVFASKTPFQINELADSFVKLANRGFTPTMMQLKSLGDLASSVGKPFDQLTEAILDAMTGENERLKEFGIRAKKMGQLTQFTFKGVTTSVQSTETAIRDYILSLGKLQGVSGSMNAISKTLGGQISNLRDNFGQLQLRAGTALNDTFQQGIMVLNRFIEVGSEVVDNFGIITRALQPIGTALQTVFRAFTSLLERFGLFSQASSPVVSVLKVIAGLITALAIPIEFLANIIAFLVNNIDFAIQFLGTFAVVLGAVTVAYLALNPQLALFIANLAIAKARALALIGVQKTWLVIQRALNFALRANPIGIIITLVGALALGITALWRNSETFRRIASVAFNAVIAPIRFVTATVNALLSVIRGVLEWLGLISKQADENIEKGRQLDSAMGNSLNKRLELQQMINQATTEELEQRLKLAKLAEATIQKSSVGKFFGLENAKFLTKDIEQELKRRKQLEQVSSSTGLNVASSTSQQALSGVSGGGAKETNITINIDKFQDSINISTTNLQEGTQDIQRELEQMLLRVINSGNQVATS